MAFAFPMVFLVDHIARVVYSLWSQIAVMTEERAMGQDSSHVKSRSPRHAPNGKEEDRLDKFIVMSFNMAIEDLLEGDNERRLHWLLEFVTRPDLARLTEDQLYELQSKIASFCLFEGRKEVGIDPPDLSRFRFGRRKLVNIAAKLYAAIESALKGRRIGPVRIERTVHYDRGEAYEYFAGRPEDL
jgi:hypothetical protein